MHQSVFEQDGEKPQVGSLARRIHGWSWQAVCDVVEVAVDDDH